MKARIGTKNYDTDKAVLVETREDGVQVYRKVGRARDVFLYNPSAKSKKEMFTDVSADESEKYLYSANTSESVYRSTCTVRFSPNDRNRINRLANSKQMSMSKFILMLVDEYERNHDEG